MKKQGLNLESISRVAFRLGTKLWRLRAPLTFHHATVRIEPQTQWPEPRVNTKRLRRQPLICDTTVMIFFPEPEVAMPKKTAHKTRTLTVKYWPGNDNSVINISFSVLPGLVSKSPDEMAEKARGGNGNGQEEARHGS